MRTSRKSFPAQIMRHQKQNENVQYLNYLGSMMTNDATCNSEIKSRIAMAKQHIQQKEDYFHQQIGLQFKEVTSEIHLENSIV
jgi:hypothetical protein